MNTNVDQLLEIMRRMPKGLTYSQRVEYLKEHGAENLIPYLRKPPGEEHRGTTITDLEEIVDSALGDNR